MMKHDYNTQFKAYRPWENIMIDDLQHDLLVNTVKRIITKFHHFTTNSQLKHTADYNNMGHSIDSQQKVPRFGVFVTTDATMTLTENLTTIIIYH